MPETDNAPGGDPRRIMIYLIATLVIAGPAAGFIWHELSEALLGRPHGPLLIAAIVLLGALLGALTLVARRLGRPGRG